MNAAPLEPAGLEEAEPRAVNLHSAAQVGAVVLEHVGLQVVRAAQPKHQAPHHLVLRGVHRSDGVRTDGRDVEGPRPVVAPPVRRVQARVQPSARAQMDVARLRVTKGDL